MTNNIVADLAEKFTRLGTGTSYGAPVTVDGVEIIPVAIGSFGFGAGEGEADGGSSKTGEGEGGGGGGISLPIGAYVKGPEGVRFEPNVIALLTVATPLVWVIGHALKTVIRAFKK